jgi:hypothetical protein
MNGIQRYDVILGREDGGAYAREEKHPRGKYVLHSAYVELEAQINALIESWDDDEVMEWAYEAMEKLEKLKEYGS